MAQAFPAFRFFGFDYHAPSIVTAQLRKVFTEAVFTSDLPLKKALEFPILSNISTSCMDLV